MNFKNVKFSVDYMKVLHSDDDVMITELRLLHVGKNRNNCHISEEAVIESIDTFYNKPIIYEIANNATTSYSDDFGDHNKDLSNSTMSIAGSIIESGGYRFEEENGKKYLHMIGIVHKIYQPAVSKIIRSRSGDVKISIEIKPIKAHKASDGSLIIEKFKLLGVCLLGRPILEGIEGSKVNVLKYSAEQYNEKYLKFSKECFTMVKMGTKPAIKLDKTKDSMSTSAWGDVDKVTLRNNILQAKNYKTLVKSVYLLVEDGWEEAPSEHLKYPVMEIKEGKLVYNRYALSTALAYAEKEKETSVIRKVRELYKKMEIQEKEGERVEDVVKNEMTEAVVEEVIENSEEVEEIIENAEEVVEEENVEVVEKEDEEDDEDEDEKECEEAEEKKVVDYEEYSMLKADFARLSEELELYKREKEVAQMYSLIEEYSHCYSCDDKKTLMNSIESSDYATLETKVNEMVKSFAKQMKEVKEDKHEKQEFSTGLNIVEKIFEAKEFNLEDYVNNFKK